ncbi:MAG: ribosomal L7Ae/L30e/S12e/Gadd45 family protein [Clostridiales bacterium]|nr:ribosomal L7Ae/L30e/S12e/Gadd45 family protein [Clostridiales bacterium]MDY3745831.1 ribosomal L7Ae/L30e/S12e/Gadd45 family protein [Lachnospiraceae bacterium]
MGIDRVLSLIGLATKAGKVVSGEFSTERAVKSKKAYMVIVASDASENTKTKFENCCNYYKVPMLVYGTKETLGRAMGKELRASLALTDMGFVKAIEKLAGPEV